MKVFGDTHIFVDYYLNRSGGVVPLGEFAFQFFKSAVECKFFVIICQPVIDEICDAISKTEQVVWEMVLCNLRDAKKIELVEFSKEQVKEARILSKERDVPLYDALFAIVARDNDAVLVSRDAHHSERLSDLVNVFKPEELNR